MPISGTLVQVLAAMFTALQLDAGCLCIAFMGHARAALSSRHTLAAEHGGTSAKSY
jgi:hypothetical protein